MVPTISRTGEGVDDLFHVIIGLYEGADFMGQRKKYRTKLCVSSVNGMMHTSQTINSKATKMTRTALLRVTSSAISISITDRNWNEA